MHQAPLHVLNQKLYSRCKHWLVRRRRMMNAPIFLILMTSMPLLAFVPDAAGVKESGTHMTQSSMCPPQVDEMSPVHTSPISPGSTSTASCSRPSSLVAHLRHLNCQTFPVHLFELPAGRRPQHLHKVNEILFVTLGNFARSFDSRDADGKDLC